MARVAQIEVPTPIPIFPPRGKEVVVSSRRDKTMELKSRRHTAADVDGAMELCYTNGWSDGFPVIAPTEERIVGMLAAAGLEPSYQCAFIENRQISVTAEKVAINAVMAGCKAEYFPAVVAAVEAIGDPQYGYH